VALQKTAFNRNDFVGAATTEAGTEAHGPAALLGLANRHNRELGLVAVAEGQGGGQARRVDSEKAPAGARATGDKGLHPVTGESPRHEDDQVARAADALAFRPKVGDGEFDLSGPVRLCHLVSGNCAAFDSRLSSPPASTLSLTVDPSGGYYAFGSHDSFHHKTV